MTTAQKLDKSEKAYIEAWRIYVLAGTVKAEANRACDVAEKACDKAGKDFEKASYALAETGKALRLRRQPPIARNCLTTEEA